MKVVVGPLLIFSWTILCLQDNSPEYRCPIGFTEIRSGLCVIYVAGSLKYCSAHYVCSDLGRKHGLRLFMVGRSISSMRTFLNNRNSVFTGLHSLLFDVKSTKDTWQSAEPGYNTVPERYPWGTKEPSSGTEQVTVYNSDGLLRSSTQGNSSNAVVCQVTQLPSPSQSQKEIFRQNWPKLLRHKTMQSKYSLGCWKNSTEPTIHKCALKCHLNDHCRSLYYHPFNKWCYLAMYVNSRLPAFLQRDDKFWIRFGRPKW